jgi:hypothetical protein
LQIRAGEVNMNQRKNIFYPFLTGKMGAFQFVSNSIYASSLRAERSNPEKQTVKLDCFTLRVRNDEATN